MQQLTELSSFLPGLEQTEITTVVDEPCWLTAWTCEVWPSGDRSRVSAYLMVYRSVLVKDTSSMYEPVADLLLGAERAEVLRTADCDDESMMFGQSEALLIRLSRHGANPPYTAAEVKLIIDALEKELF